jgi:hypothetical protein
VDITNTVYNPKVIQATLAEHPVVYGGVSPPSPPLPSFPGPRRRGWGQALGDLVEVLADGGNGDPPALLAEGDLAEADTYLGQRREVGATGAGSGARRCDRAVGGPQPDRRAEALVFPGRWKIAPVSPQLIRDQFQVVAEKAGLGELRRPIHTLRHTNARLRREVGASVEDVQAALDAPRSPPLPSTCASSRAPSTPTAPRSPPCRRPLPGVSRRGIVARWPRARCGAPPTAPRPPLGARPAVRPVGRRASCARRPPPPEW